jgi:hypothetical protein
MERKRREEEGQTIKVSCQEVCATACKNCHERCLRECTIAKKSGAGNCKQVTSGCCDDCKDDCLTVCDLCANVKN